MSWLKRAARSCERAIAVAWQHGDQRIDDLGRVPADSLTKLASEAVAIAQPVDDLAAAIASALGRPIDLASWGPTAADKRPR